MRLNDVVMDWRTPVLLAAIAGLYLLASSFDYQDELDRERSRAERDARLAQACLPQAPGESAFIAWETADKLLCLRTEPGGRKHAATFDGARGWRSM